MDLNTVVWRKSRRSDDMGGHCVELADLSEAVAVRDSKDPDGPKLIVTRDAFRAFTATLKQR